MNRVTRLYKLPMSLSQQLLNELAETRNNEQKGHAPMSRHLNYKLLKAWPLYNGYGKFVRWDLSICNPVCMRMHTSR
jgi:hypothetical protein